MPRVQGCPTHTAFLPYIFTPSFPGVTHREAIVYISVWIIISGQKIEDRVYVGRHKYKTIFSFRANFFDSGIKKPPDFSGGRGQRLCDNQANFMAVNSLAKRSTPLWILSIVLRLGLRLPCRKWPSCAWLTPVIFSSPEREKMPAYSERKLAVS